MDAIDVLNGRLDRLEKENRKLKRTLMVLCLAGGALFVMGQTQGVPKVVVAEKFVLKNAAGEEAARLEMTDTGPQLKMQDARANRPEYTSIINPTVIRMYKTGGENNANSVMGPAGMFFTIQEGKEEQKVGIHASGPTIELSDKQGFETVIGSTNLETKKTGESRKTSAASIVIFNKAGTVIWKAPTD